MLREALKKLQLQCHCPYQVDGRDGQNPYYEATNYRYLQLWVEGGGVTETLFPYYDFLSAADPSECQFFCTLLFPCFLLTATAGG